MYIQIPLIDQFTVLLVLVNHRGIVSEALFIKLLLRMQSDHDLKVNSDVRSSFFFRRFF